MVTMFLVKKKHFVCPGGLAVNAILVIHTMYKILITTIEASLGLCKKGTGINS